MSSKDFGIFCGLISTVTNQKFSVKQAEETPEILALYERTKNAIVESKFKIKSTRRASLESLNLPLLDAEVLAHIKKHPELTRHELAVALGRRRSTICGCVSRLKDSGLVRVSGSTTDEETKKSVQTLIAIEGGSHEIA